MIETHDERLGIYSRSLALFFYMYACSSGLLSMIPAPSLVFTVTWSEPPTATLLLTLLFPCVHLLVSRLVQLLQKPTEAQYQQYFHSLDIACLQYANILLFSNIYKKIDGCFERKILILRRFKYAN